MGCGCQSSPATGGAAIREAAKRFSKSKAAEEFWPPGWAFPPTAPHLGVVLSRRAWTVLQVTPGRFVGLPDYSSWGSRRHNDPDPDAPYHIHVFPEDDDEADTPPQWGTGGGCGGGQRDPTEKPEPGGKPQPQGETEEDDAGDAEALVAERKGGEDPADEPEAASERSAVADARRKNCGGAWGGVDLPEGKEDAGAWAARGYASGETLNATLNWVWAGLGGKSKSDRRGGDWLPTGYAGVMPSGMYFVMYYMACEDGEIFYAMVELEPSDGEWTGNVYHFAYRDDCEYVRDATPTSACWLG